MFSTSNLFEIEKENNPYFTRIVGIWILFVESAQKLVRLKLKSLQNNGRNLIITLTLSKKKKNLL